MMLHAVDHVQDGTGGLEALMTQTKMKQKVLKDYLQSNMSMWDDNIKVDIKETSFIFGLNFSLRSGVRQDYRKRELCYFAKKILNIFIIF
jgi:hypothetical protein